MIKKKDIVSYNDKKERRKVAMIEREERTEL